MKNKNNVIKMGIDPGKEGFLAYNKGETLCFLYMQDFLIGTEYSPLLISKFFKSLLEEGYKMHVVLEDVNSDPSWGAVTNWSLSRCKAIFETIFAALNIPFTLVKPKTWQKEMFQGIKELRKPSKTITRKNGTQYVRKGNIDTKPMSILAAQRLYPEVDLRKNTRSKNDHDGKSDSLLMYEYCKRHF